MEGGRALKASTELLMNGLFTILTGFVLSFFFIRDATLAINGRKQNKLKNQVARCLMASRGRCQTVREGEAGGEDPSRFSGRRGTI